MLTLTIAGDDAGVASIPSLAGAAGRGGADVGRNSLSPISDAYDAPFAFAGTIHSVDIEITPSAADLAPGPLSEERSQQE